MHVSPMTPEEKPVTPPIAISKEPRRKEQRDKRLRVITEQQEIFAYLFCMTADIPTKEEYILSWQKLSLGEKMIWVTKSPIQRRIHAIMKNASIQDVRNIKTYLSHPTTPHIDPRLELMGLWIKSKTDQEKDTTDMRTQHKEQN